MIDLNAENVLKLVRHLDAKVLRFKCALLGELKARYERDRQQYVQRLTRDMAAIMGMEDCHFSVSLKKGMVGIAGCIQRQEYLGFTMIDVDEGLMDYNDTLVCVLAHELSHKFLQLHALELQDKDENELLTDVTSVYLGFGRYVLNGMCYGQGYKSKVGYLDEESFAFVYEVVSGHLRISEKDMWVGLRTNAQDALIRARSRFREHCDVNVVAYRMVLDELDHGRSIMTKMDEMLKRIPQYGAGPKFEERKLKEDFIIKEFARLKLLADFLATKLNTTSGAKSSDSKQRYEFSKRVVDFVAAAEFLSNYISSFIRELLGIEDTNAKLKQYAVFLNPLSIRDASQTQAVSQDDDASMRIRTKILKVMMVVVAIFIIAFVIRRLL